MSTETKKEYKVVKNFVKQDEALAKQKAAERAGLPIKLMQAGKHTKTCFVFVPR